MGFDVHISSHCSGSEANFGQRLDLPASGFTARDGVAVEHWLRQGCVKDFSESRFLLIDSPIGVGKSSFANLLADAIGGGKSSLSERLKDCTLTFAPGVGFDSTLQIFLYIAAHGSYDQCAGTISRVTKFEAAWRAATTRHKAVRPVLDSAINRKVKTLCSWANLSWNLKLQVKRIYDGLHRVEFLRTLSTPHDDLAFAIRLVVRWFRFILRFFRLLPSFNNGRRLRIRVEELPKIQRTFTVLRN